MVQSHVPTETPHFDLLIVEDDPVQRRLFVAACQKFGWTVREAPSGAEGLKALENPKGHVVLSDLQLPDMSGLEMLQTANKKHFRAVALTVSEKSEEIISAFSAGISDYVIKPVKDWDKLNLLLLAADADLLAEKQKAKELATLQQQADWQYWKALFLSGGQSNEMLRVLDMMHIQFNQDANYVHLLKLLRELKPDQSGHVLMPEDLHSILTNALDPIARFADGIGIAQNVMHKTPSLQSYTLNEFVDWLHDIYEKKIKPIAHERSRTIATWFDENMRSTSGYIHMEPDLLERALTEVVINALKYSESDDEIDVNVQVTNEETINFMITNPARKTTRGRNGERTSGLPRELEELAFRFFIRFSIDTQTNYNEQWPMGLGLPLVRQVVSSHGGEIAIHNESWHLGGASGGGDASGGGPNTIVACRIELPINEEALLVEEGPDAEDDGLELF